MEETFVLVNLGDFIEVQLGVSLNQSKRVFQGKFRGYPVAIKKVLLAGSFDNHIANLSAWKDLAKLKNENIIIYYQCCIQKSFRYIVMELCLGSMLNYCQKKIPYISDLDICKTMWETVCGLDYLHDNNIVHGHLLLENILLWRKSPDCKPITKIGGYFPPCDSRQAINEDYLNTLGRIFYSMATNNVANSIPDPIVLGHLTEFQKHQRRSALIFIKMLILKNKLVSQTASVKILQKHPLFTINLESARNSLTKDDIGNVENLQKWYENGNINSTGSDEDDFNGLKQTLLSNNVSETVRLAFENFPELFSEFVWHLATSSQPPANLTFIKGKMISSGSYGYVFSGKWINEDGKEIPAACKTLKRENEGEFEKEFQALRQLDHFFIIKCFGMCEIKNEKCIIMELCEGTLEQYVLGGLEKIPANTLDDKFLLGQITLGLAYIHSKKMIHKDLKPANILLWRQSPTSTLVLAKIVNFGFAKTLMPHQTQFSGTQHLGTKECMAPELLAKLDRNDDDVKALATFDSDAYSLGITIAFTVLKGQHSFGRKFLQPPLMSSGCDHILPENLEWDVTDLILRLTKTEPTERPNLGLVIYHPYFALSNENTKIYFHEKVCAYFELFKFSFKFSKFFYRENIKLWMEVVKRENKNDKNTKAIKTLQQFDNEYVQDILLKMQRSSRENCLKIKTALMLEESKSVFKCIDDRKYFHFSFFKRLITTAPEFFVSYIWQIISDRTGIKPFIPTEQKPETHGGLESLKMAECTFVFLFTKKENEEMWNLSTLKNNNSIEESFYHLKCNIPVYTTSTDFVEKICKNSKDINYVKENEGNLLCWALKNRWTVDISLVKNLLKNRANSNGSIGRQKRTALHLAAKNETVEGPQLIKLLLKNDGDPNIVDKRKSTPLHYAAKNESSSAPEMLKLLLEKGGDPNIVDYCESTPLHCAAKNESSSAPEMLKLLLEKGSDPNIVDYCKSTPLHYVAENESSSAPEMLKLLLEKGSDPNIVDYCESTPLHYVAENESSSAPEMLKLLLEKGSDPNIVDCYTYTPLHYIAKNELSSAPEMLKLLLEKGGDPNIVDYCESTPLHYVAKNESSSVPEMLKLLLEKGDDPNIVDDIKSTPLHYVAENESSSAPEMLKLLLEKGGDPNIVDYCESTPLHYVAKNESSFAPEMLKLLLEKGDDPNIVDDSKSTPLHYVAENESSSAPEMLKLLLEKGGDPNISDDTNVIPLHCVSRNTSNSAPEMLKLLLDKGGDPNIVGNRNCTPLHYVATNKSSSAPEMLKLLLEKGGDPNIVGDTKFTPLHYAAQNILGRSATELIKILLMKEVDPNARDENDDTPVHFLAVNKSSSTPEILKILIEKGGNPNIFNKYIQTPVHFASQNTSIFSPEILKILLENGGEAGAFDKNGLTPAHYALRNESNSSPEILKILLNNYTNPNDFDHSLKTLVHHAVCNQSKFSVDFLKILLQRDGNPNAIDDFGDTPLHWAVRKHCFPEMVELLLKFNGNPNFPNSIGSTPVHYAAKNDSKVGLEILKLLLERGGNPNVANELKRTPVHYAAENEFETGPDLMILFLEKECDVYVADMFGKTPMDYANRNQSFHGLRIKLTIDEKTKAKQAGKLTAEANKSEFG